MARKLIAIAPDGSEVVTRTDAPYTHMVIAEETSRYDSKLGIRMEPRWVRVSAHTRHDLAVKSQQKWGGTIVQCFDPVEDAQALDARRREVASEALAEAEDQNEHTITLSDEELAIVRAGLYALDEITSRMVEENKYGHHYEPEDIEDAEWEARGADKLLSNLPAPTKSHRPSDESQEGRNGA